MYCSPTIVRVMEFRNLKLVGLVARVHMSCIQDFSVES